MQTKRQIASSTHRLFAVMPELELEFPYSLKYVPPHNLPYGFSHATWETVSIVDARKFVSGIPEIVTACSLGPLVNSNAYSPVTQQQHTELAAPDSVPMPTRQTALHVQQTRVARGLTQACLARFINEKVAVVRDLEMGRQLPPPRIITRIERALGIRIDRRGKQTIR